MSAFWRTIAFYASAVLVGMVLGYVLHAPPAPAPSVAVAVQQSRAAHAVSVQRETTYVQDTARAAYWFAKYDSARVHAVRLPAVAARVTDAVTHDSIVYVRMDVADSTVRACRDVLNSCAALHAADSAEIHALHTEIAARDAARPSRLRTILTYSGAVAIGYVAGRAGIGAGLSLRLPFGSGH